MLVLNANGDQILLVLFIILAGVCLAFISFLKTPDGIGWVGEMYIRHLLKTFKQNGDYVINDVIVLDEESGRTSQIDHILVSKKGIIVIETKNYSGRVYGSEEQLNWTQVLRYGKIKNKIYNPRRQNQTHVYRIKKLLPPGIKVVSFIAFVRSNPKYVKASNVFYPKDMIKKIKALPDNALTDAEKETCYKILANYKENPVQTNTEHVNEIHEMQKNISEGICPRCGGKLVVRHSAYGDFLGCENYPKCKFTKKI